MEGRKGEFGNFFYLFHWKPLITTLQLKRPGMEFSSMKTLYNEVNALICFAKEARASIVLDIEWVQFVLQNCEKQQNHRFK